MRQFSLTFLLTLSCLSLRSDFAYVCAFTCTVWCGTVELAVWKLHKNSISFSAKGLRFPAVLVRSVTDINGEEDRCRQIELAQIERPLDLMPLQ